MRILRPGDMTESNIFNQLDEKKKALLAAGEDVINLSIGTPDLPPSSHILQAVSKACLDPAQYRYSLTETPEVICAVQHWYARRYGVTLEQDELMMVAGSQEGIAHLAFPFVQPGDLVLAPDPGYPIFSFGPLMAGARVALYPLYAEKGWVLDFADIPAQTAQRAKLMIVSYPNNPTTATADADFYRRLVDFAKKYDIRIIHDNAYSDLRLDGKLGDSFLTTPGAKEVGVELNSLSKTYNVTGMRASFVVGNREMIGKFRAFRSQIDYGTFYPVQAGAVAALEGSQQSVEQLRSTYQARSEALCGGLRRIGWHVPNSTSTMFVWAKLPTPYTDAVAFTLLLMEKTGIICVPGDSFGAQGKGYVRFALVVPPERMTQAVERIAQSGILTGTEARE